MLAIVNYNAGNLTSVKRALDYLEIPNRITEKKDEMLGSDGVVIPGVGAAGSAMQYLAANGLDKALGECAKKEKPLLGICLGSQIVLDYSPENDTTALGLIPGRCQAFHPDLKDERGELINIPHMGWNSVRLNAPCLLFKDIDPGAEFYFVHTYYPQPEKKYILGETDYGTTFCSVLGREGLWAMQFHPEKSGRPGLRILKNFYSYCRGELNA
jgi:glutamine amidotransferase